MSATELRQDFRSRYCFRLTADLTGLITHLDPVLRPLAKITGADTAIVYRFLKETSEFIAIAAYSELRSIMQNTEVMLTSGVSGWLYGLAHSVQGTPSDERFERFPEVVQYRVETVLAVPLRNADKIQGLLTLGRQSSEQFSPEGIALTEQASALISTVMERDDLKKRLSERKVVERAKGILQQRRGLTEEHAYRFLRNTSRRRRLPIVSVATEILNLSRSTQS